MKKAIPKVIPFKGRKRYSRILGGVPQTHGMKSGYVVLGPGEEVGEHTTGPREEIIVILSGNACVVWGERGRRLAARKNSVVYMPPETRHNVINSSRRAALRYIYAVSPVT